MEKYNNYIGLSLDEFKSIIEGNENYNITKINNGLYVMACSYKSDCLNLTIENNIITKITLG